MDPITYTKEEIAEFAKGVFGDDKTSPVIYANDTGKFLNHLQYEALQKDEKADEAYKKSFTYKFENPNVKKETVANEVIIIDGEPISAADAAKLVADLKAEIERLNTLKTVAAAKDLQTQLDAANAKIAELTKPQ